MIDCSVSFVIKFILFRNYFNHHFIIDYNYFKIINQPKNWNKGDMSFIRLIIVAIYWFYCLIRLNFPLNLFNKDNIPIYY